MISTMAKTDRPPVRNNLFRMAFILYLFSLQHSYYFGMSTFLRSDPPSERIVERRFNQGFIAMIDLLAIRLAYPDLKIDVRTDSKLDQTGSGSAKILLVFDSETVIPYDDGRIKTFHQKLNDPDIQDMMVQLYPDDPFPRFQVDPGRFRNQSFFFALYGSSRRKIHADCQSISLLGQSLLLHKKLTSVFKSLSAAITWLVKRKPKLRPFIIPPGGGFNWRLISGTTRLSPHSYGIAIDLNTERGGYWKWDQKRFGGNRSQYRNRLMKLRNHYPSEIVKLFEKHQFIWGGKWYHYDLMHFEYRPELFIKRKLLHLFNAIEIMSPVLLSGCAVNIIF